MPRGVALDGPCPYRYGVRAECGEERAGHPDRAVCRMCAPLIQDDVVKYLGNEDEDVMPTLQKFQEAISKYKFMEMSTAQRRQGLEQKIPDITNTLKMVEYLKKHKVRYLH